MVKEPSQVRLIFISTMIRPSVGMAVIERAMAKNKENEIRSTPLPTLE
jgi:hypothetical protein